ncbi:Ubiquinone/menaquinone biosynthesis C-methyltransferase UbiE [Cladorrhinum samala]|uniref:Ubiquinone/menaquinone biosynthesis C-methyltransferase UbiE n=1 Tax=Cladorrhinum samala TaxID=585594 RepID=A0AAV9HE61_9PEZI|nr:Ubiquinone/menaquinone biosynthesis C-methyltransferase UbiE [Cladorrhinum samala]
MEEPEHSRDSFAERRRRANRQSTEKIEQWLSPLSDHFPTPRGMHFLAAPILPETPSCVPSDYEADNDHLDNDDASSNASSSNPSFQWNPNRESIMTDVTEFDDLYDVSDDETQRKQRLQANGISRQRGSSKSTRSLKRSSRVSAGSRRSLTPLVIPEEQDNAAGKKMLSPIPPTPPSAVAMSPAVLRLMELRQAQEIPRISAPPSLDGSINSEEMAALSAPPTPVIGCEDKGDQEWSGVQLQPGALETLQALSGSESEVEDAPTRVIELPQEMAEARPQRPRLNTGVVGRAPSFNRLSLAGLSKLVIPSPGGFFSELSSASRRTWNVNAGSQGPPPRPLHLDEAPSAIVERVIEWPAALDPEDLPTAIRIESTPVPITARRVPPTPKQTEGVASETVAEEPSSPIVVNEIVAEYDPDYVKKQEENALSHADRTQLWLMAQRSYLQGVTGFSEEHEETAASAQEPDAEVKPEPAPKDVEVEVEPRQKGVRFSEVPSTDKVPRNLPPKLLRQESAYYRAFTDLTVRSNHNDVFIHRQPRFEALQAQRVSLKEAHRNQLLGKYQLTVVPQSAKKRMSTNVVRGDDNLVDDPEKLRADKEADALSQMNMAAWNVSATKLLNGGRLISAPVGKRLARQSTFAPNAKGLSRDRARILDLGGPVACDWGWHAALQYPNTKVYTVTTKTIRQLSNCNPRGPPNHRQVAVERLTKLPFADDQFDLISARELHAVLKLSGENGVDEWDACLKECMRVLKPGGYIEFSVLDADIVNAGPMGNAKSVEFSFALQTLGYDPKPTRCFLSRLAHAGFDDVRRAWVCLPVGPKHLPRPTVVTARDSTSGETVQVHQMEAVVSGSTDNAAAITGVAAGWSWERWMLRAEMEKIAGELRLADTVTPGKAMHEAGKMIADVHAVVEEGRVMGSQFRTLKGYAKKPMPRPDADLEEDKEVSLDEFPMLDRCGTIRVCLDSGSLC